MTTGRTDRSTSNADESARGGVNDSSIDPNGNIGNVMRNIYRANSVGGRINSERVGSEQGATQRQATNGTRLRYTGSISNRRSIRLNLNRNSGQIPQQQEEEGQAPNNNNNNGAASSVHVGSDGRLRVHQNGSNFDSAIHNFIQQIQQQQEQQQQDGTTGNASAGNQISESSVHHAPQQQQNQPQEDNIRGISNQGIRRRQVYHLRRVVPQQQQQNTQQSSQRRHQQQPNPHLRRSQQGIAQQHLPRQQQQHQSIAPAALRVTPGTTQIQVNANGTVSLLSSSANAQNAQAQALSRMPLPPLQPQPTPYSIPAQNDNDHTDNEHDTDDEDDNDNDNGEYDIYRCPICYEFLMEPSSCGKCSSRFCFSCIRRVASSSLQPKCPTCRAPFSAANIQRDLALKATLEQKNIKIKCPYQGCAKRIPAREAKEHEARCGHCPMRCRYAPLGCSWRGKRMHLEHHEANHCPLAPIGPFVEQVRQSRAEHAQAITTLQHRAVVSNGMWEVHSRMLRTQNPKPSNFFHLMNAISTMCCTPALYLFQQELWREFHSTAHGRGRLASFLFLLPTFIQIFRTGIRGYRMILGLELDRASQVRNVEDLELAILSIIIPALGVLVIICLLIDKQSPQTWSTFRLGSIDREIMRDICLVLLCLTQVATFESDGLGWKALTVWFLVAISTLFFPPFVITFVGYASNNNNLSVSSVDEVWKTSRCADIVICSLFYGICLSQIGVQATLDASFVLHLAARWIGFLRARRLVSSRDEEIWSIVPNELKIALVGAKFAAWAVGYNSLPLASLWALLFIPFLNVLVDFVSFYGMFLGQKLAVEGRHDYAPQNAMNGTFHAEYSITGTAMFCGWVITLGMIGFSY